MILKVCLNKQIRKMFVDEGIHIAKLPASLSGRIQPNDRMSSHRDIKIPVEINDKMFDDANQSLMNGLKTALADYSVLNGSQQQLVLNFFGNAKTVITNAFSVDKIKSGYDLSKLYPYAPGEILDLCRNLAVEVDTDTITALKGKHMRGLLEEEMKKNGRVRDKFMDKLNIPKIYREKRESASSCRQKGMFDFTGPNNGQCDFYFDDHNRESYTEESIAWIDSFPQGTKTRWLLSLFLKKRTVGIGDKKAVVVDKLIPTRQRCCILSLPAFYKSEKARIRKVQKAKEKEAREKVRKATEKQEQRNQHRALQARCKDPADKSVYCCFLCKTIVDIETLEDEDKLRYAFGGCRQQFKPRFFCHACHGCHGCDDTLGHFALQRHASSCKQCAKKLNSEEADESKVATEHDDSGSESEEDFPEFLEF